MPEKMTKVLKAAVRMVPRRVLQIQVAEDSFPRRTHPRGQIGPGF